MPLVSKIISEKPDAKPVSPEHNLPVIASHDIKTNLTDAKKIPPEYMLTHVSGMPLRCNYYPIHVGKDNILLPQDVGQSSVYQQYRKIVNFEIRLSGSFSINQSDDDKAFSVTGDALVHSGVVANTGDMFTADIGDGRVGVFAVTNSMRSTIRAGAIYQIRFSLVYFASDKVRMDQLEEKVVETVFYVKDLMRHNRSPFIASEIYASIEELRKSFQTLYKFYFEKFFSEEFRTLLVPTTQAISIYDHFVASTMRYIAGLTQDVQVTHKMQQFSFDESSPMRMSNLWTAMLDRNPMALETGIFKTGCVNRVSFGRLAQSRHFRFTGVDFVVYPKDYDLKVEQNLTLMGKHDTQDGIITDQAPFNTRSTPTLIETLEYEGASVPLIKKVTDDEYYVLSEDFYKRTENQSVLEMLVNNYLDGHPMDAVRLKMLVDQAIYWGKVEIFYYVPLLLILIQATVIDHE